MWTEQLRFDFGRVSWLQFGASLQVSASSDAFRQPACRTTLVFVARTFWERCWEFCWADWQSFCRTPLQRFGFRTCDLEVSTSGPQGTHSLTQGSFSSAACRQLNAAAGDTINLRAFTPPQTFSGETARHGTLSKW